MNIPSRSSGSPTLSSIRRPVRCLMTSQRCCRIASAQILPLQMIRPISGFMGFDDNEVPDGRGVVLCTCADFEFRQRMTAAFN